MWESRESEKKITKNQKRKHEEDYQACDQSPAPMPNELSTPRRRTRFKSNLMNFLEIEKGASKKPDNSNSQILSDPKPVVKSQKLVHVAQ